MLNKILGTLSALWSRVRELLTPRISRQPQRLQLSAPAKAVERKPMRNRDRRPGLFDGFGLALLQAKADARFYVDAQKAVTPKIEAYAGGLVRQFPWLQGERDDLIQEGLLTFWREMRRFYFWCPVCGEKFGSADEFDRHCVEIHGCQLTSRSDIALFLGSRVKAYMRHYATKSVAQCRDARKTVELDGDGWQESETVHDRRTPEDEAATAGMFAQIRRLIEAETDRRIREMVEACLRGDRGVEIYRRLVAVGIYGSVNSARACVHRLRSKGRFASYASILSAF